MAGEDHPVGGGRLGDHFDDDVGIVRIEVGGRLIEDEHIRSVAEAVLHSYECQSTLLAGAQRRCLHPQIGGQSCGRQGRPRAILVETEEVQFRTDGLGEHAWGLRHIGRGQRIGGGVRICRQAADERTEHSCLAGSGSAADRRHARPGVDGPRPSDDRAVGIEHSLLSRPAGDVERGLRRLCLRHQRPGSLPGFAPVFARMVTGSEFPQGDEAFRCDEQHQQAIAQIHRSVDQAQTDDHGDECHRDRGDEFEGQAGEERDAQSRQVRLMVALPQFPQTARMIA